MTKLTQTKSDFIIAISSKLITKFTFLILFRGARAPQLRTFIICTHLATGLFNFHVECTPDAVTLPPSFRPLSLVGSHHRAAQNRTVTAV